MVNYNQFSLREYIGIIYSHKIYFIVFPVLLLIISYFIYDLRTPTFTARVKILVKATKPIEAVFYTGILSADVITEHSELVKSNVVLKRVVNALKLYEIPEDNERKYATPTKKWLIDYRSKKRKLPKRGEQLPHDQDKSISVESAIGRLSSQIEVEPIKSSNLFYLSATNFNPGIAIKIANSVSRSYLIFDMQQQVEELKLRYGNQYALVLQLEDYIKEYEQTLSEGLIPDMKAYGPATIKVIEQAKGAWKNKGPNKELLLLFSFITGIFLAGGLTLISEFFSDKVRTPKNLLNLEVPFLGSIPKRKKKDVLIMSNKEISSSLSCVRAFQSLGDKICTIIKDKNINVFLITALREFDDTSALTANLAIYLSRDVHKKILLLDGNLLRPTINNILNVQIEHNGLIDLFEGRRTFDDVVLHINERFDVLLSKTAGFRPIRLIDSIFMKSLIQDCKEKYDIVFIDCSANIITESEPVLFSSYVDAIILVANEGKDRMQDIDVGINKLRHDNNGLILTVLNNRTENIPKILHNIS